MKRLVLGVLFMAFGCRGQQTVVQQLFVNTATTPQNMTVENVGQVGHTVRIQFSNNGGNTCVNPNPTTSELDYSFDNSTWVAFSIPAKMSPNTLTATFTGSGLFNFVRFSLSGWDTTNCLASAWYTGSPQQTTVQPLPPVLSFQPFTNYTGGSTNFNIPVFGQTSHTIWMAISNIGGQTCGSGDSWRITLSGSNSGIAGSPYTILTQQVSGAVGGATTGPYFGAGAFQVLTLGATPGGSATAHCVLNAWYTGSFAGNLSAVSAYNGLGSQQLNAMQVPINQCSITGNIAVTAANTTLIAGGFSIGGITIRICQIVMTTPTAAAVATLKTSTAGSSCVSGLTTLGSFNMAVGVPVNFGGGLGSVAAIPPQLDICLQATTGNVNGIISYDYQ